MSYTHVKITDTDESMGCYEKGDIYEIDSIDEDDGMVYIIDREDNRVGLWGPESEKDGHIPECQYCDKTGNIISPSIGYEIF